jgi:HSP20 family protein
MPFTPWAGALGRGTPSMEPPADIEETADAFVIEVDLPGVAKSDVQVEHAGRQVIITAERRERERVGQLRTGTCRVGTFRLVIDLPCDTSESGVGAALADGVLTVRVPKLNPAATRRIPVA